MSLTSALRMPQKESWGMTPTLINSTSPVTKEMLIMMPFSQAENLMPPLPRWRLSRRLSLMEKKKALSFLRLKPLQLAVRQSLRKMMKLSLKLLTRKRLLLLMIMGQMMRSNLPLRSLMILMKNLISTISA